MAQPEKKEEIIYSSELRPSNVAAQACEAIRRGVQIVAHLGRPQILFHQRHHTQSNTSATPFDVRAFRKTAAEDKRSRMKGHTIWCWRLRGEAVNLPDDASKQGCAETGPTGQDPKVRAFRAAWNSSARGRALRTTRRLSPSYCMSVAVLLTIARERCCDCSVPRRSLGIEKLQRTSPRAAHTPDNGYSPRKLD